MSILSSLERAYHRLAKEDKVPPIGYSDERIDYCVVLNADGQPVGLPVDLRDHSGRRPVALPHSVPRPEKRTIKIVPNFLWDKASYSLGSVEDVKNETPDNRERRAKRVAEQYKAFQNRHLVALQHESDTGLVACYRFLQWWKPEYFDIRGWPDEMKGANVVFRLEGERNFIHDHEAARQLWASQMNQSRDSDQAVCLITGARSSVARLHPSIKGVRGAQSSGASIVSFNLDAFTSYGHKQGDNAPVSEDAAAAYTSVLNHFLRTNENRVQIGDSSTVFWADGSNVEAAEAIFASFFNDTNEEGDEISEQIIKPILEKISSGRPMEEIRPDLPQGVRFYVLGLAPNAARISIRFWMEDDFATLAEHILWHYRDLRLDSPRQEQPSIWRCLLETASTKVKNRYEHVPPQLAGDMLRAILTGRAYPQTLLSTILMRLRSDKAITDLRIALLKAVICRKRRMAGHLQKEDFLVSLDPTNADPGYLLGRLFACFEYAQTQALGGKVNATICDKYYGAASATPRSVFPILQRNAMHHLSRLRKDRTGTHRYIDNTIAQIYECAAADALFVPTLDMDHQALFAIGYYHQKNAFYTPRNAGTDKKENEE